MSVVVQSNDLVVAVLEKWLARAREGEMNFVALVICESPNVYGCDHAGNSQMAPLAIEGFDLLRADLEQAVRATMAPDPDPALGADYVTYNLAAGSAGYDVVPWLADAVMTMRRAGLPGPLKVNFWLGTADAPPLEGDRLKLFRHVMRPALALFGAIETKKIGHAKMFFSTRDVTEASRAGEEVPLLKARPLPLGCQPPVTITLREAESWPHRNSNMPAWLAFAELLSDRGETVIFVRDTHKAHEPLGNWPTSPMASRELPYRMSLYQSAKANLFVSNGPAVLGIFGDRPYLQFIEIMADDHPYPVNTEKFWREHQGIAVGEQWPWARPDQRIVWKKDEYDTIVEAWDNLWKTSP